MKRIRRIAILTLLAALAATMLLFAGCAKKVTLKFEANGGTAVPAITAEAGSAVELPEPQKSGYAFDGWYLSSELSGEGMRGSITAPEKNTTYYAKWATAYEVTFDTDGGVFAEGEPTLSLAAGANVYEAVKDLRPTKSGLTFGAWFSGETEVTNGFRMPEGGLALKARYKVQYTVESYFHNLAGNSYLREGEPEYGADYVGATVTPVPPTVTGFARTDAPAGETPVTTLTLDADAGRNVFRFYYDRMTYSVVYSSNLPAGLVSGNTLAGSAVYEGTVTVAANRFRANGYRFIGWSTSSTDGKVAYREGDRVTMTGDLLLYAVWEVGYFDRFGSNDVIFFPSEDPQKAILSRGEKEFEGVRNGNDFVFEISAERKLEGTVFNGMFSYKRAEIAGEYVLYDSYADPKYDGRYDEKRFDDSVKLVIDEYLNAVYTKDGHTCNGVIEHDEFNGDYRFTSADESFNCLFSETDSTTYPRVFSFGGDEADVYLDWWFIGNTSLGFSNGHVLILDGYGTAILQYPAGGLVLPFEGSYYIMGEYNVGGYSLKKIYCDVYDGMGILGSDEGTYGNYIYTFPLSEFIASEDMGEYSGYVIAEELHRGEFRADDGSTLTLDGFGIFPDSAVYTDPAGQVVYQSTYTVESDYMTGRVITAEHDGATDIFRLDAAAHSFEKLETATAKKYREYRLVNSMLDFPLVVIYEEKSGDGFKTELYMTEDDGRTVVLAADGYSSAEPLGGNFTLYRFTRTQLHNNYIDAEIPQTLEFYTTQVISAEALDEVSVYCITKYNDEAYYREIEVEGLGTLWANDYVTLTGLGSLLFGNGSVIEGGFSETQNKYFNGTYGTFIYGDGVNTYTVRFDITPGEQEDEWIGTIIEDVETELYFYYFDPSINRGSYVIDLVLGANGAASWNDDHSYGQWQTGTYAATGYTVFGEEIYTLTVGGAKLFEFIIYDSVNPDGSTTPIYFIRNEEFEGTYSGQDGSTLVLDGFCFASYSAKGSSQEGTYDIDSDGLAVYFTPDGGQGRFFELNGRTIVALDAAYGEWYLIDRNYQIINNSTIFFDGKGKVTITSASGSQNYGFYTVEAEGEQLECKVTANLGGKYIMAEYNVCLEYFENSGMYACIVYDKNTMGVFIDENWNVLRLDGYGNGTLYTADRGMAGTGYYYVVDEEMNFLDFTFLSDSPSYGSDAFLVLDPEKGTFSIQDYSDYGIVYLSAQMDYIVFGTDGGIRIGNSEGFYFVQEDAILAYLYNYETESYRKETMPLIPSGGNYTYNGTVYSRWAGGELSIGGKVQLLDKSGEAMEGRELLDVTLSFGLVLGANINLDATVTIDGQKYEGFTLNFYTDGKLAPRITYNTLDYPVTFSYHPDGASSCTISAGYTSATYQDYYANYNEEKHTGGKLTKEWIGFGPKIIEEPKYSGAFYYLYNAVNFSKPIVFTDFENKNVVINGYRAGLGDEREIVFRFKNVDYAIDFFEYYDNDSLDGSPKYSLYSFYRYEEHTANDGYKVGVKYVLFTNVANTPGFGREEDIGKPLGATLFKEDGNAVVTFDTNITVGTQDVWMVEYDAEKQAAGQGYYIDFTVDGEGKVTKVEVTLHKFWQTITAARDFMADVFLDENNDVAYVLSVAYLDYSGAFAWMDGTSDLVHDPDSGVWTFTGCMGGDPIEVTLQFIRGKDNPETGNPTFTFKAIV